jgi:hypothetical protein
VEPFIVLVVAVAVTALGLVVVAARPLFHTARRLQQAVNDAVERIRPLADELQAEAEVTAAELEHLASRQQAGRREANR